MSDVRGYNEQLPWLEAVDDEDGPPGVSARKMFTALAIVLVAALLLAGTFYWLGRSSGPSGAPELIQAEPGPYKVRPENPGGLDVTGGSETAYETSAGEDPDGQLDLTRLPQGTAVREAPEPQEATPSPAQPARPEPAAEPKAPSGAKGSVVQLGAFANRAQAERAWAALSTRFSSVAAMSKMIVPFSGGIRLRAVAASPEEARATCEALKSAGEACFIAN